MLLNLKHSFLKSLWCSSNTKVYHKKPITKFMIPKTNKNNTPNYSNTHFIKNFQNNANIIFSQQTFRNITSPLITTTKYLLTLNKIIISNLNTILKFLLSNT